MSHFKHFALFSVLGVESRPVTISNLEPRRDTNGQIVAAHDGDIVQFTPHGEYHFYGMSYGSCQAHGCGPTKGCGFQTTHNISLYTSPDLSQGSWDFQGHVLPVDNRPSGIYYRPKVVFNALTGLYVLWVNWLLPGNFGSSAYLVATASTPRGPFTVVKEKVPTAFNTGGDFDIFVDDDGEAYLIYTSLAIHHHISIERLTPDFLSSTLNTTGPLTAGGCFEAPTMFKRKGFYYALYGTCCCFCTGGDSRTAMRSTSPLGFSSASPKYSLGNVGGAQENYVVRVATTTGTEYVWTGDRWNSGPDGVKDHDFQYWAPLAFNDSFSPTSIRFIKAGDDNAIYQEENGVKHHVPSCNMCGDPCNSWVAVTGDYVRSLVTGSDFTCDHFATPILPVAQCDSFVLEMPETAKDVPVLV